MTILGIAGEIVSDLHQNKTINGIGRVSFVIESHDEGSLPLRHSVIAFGRVAERAMSELRAGTRVFCFGRLTSGGATKCVNLALSGFEVLQGGENGNVEQAG